MIFLAIIGSTHRGMRGCKINQVHKTKRYYRHIHRGVAWTTQLYCMLESMAAGVLGGATGITRTR